jgi:hypothetical protein|tara:strand:- start:474 stop:818 length:345 start_codon:yes stop_codon:yes gene_type:complete
MNNTTYNVEQTDVELNNLVTRENMSMRIEELESIVIEQANKIEELKKNPWDEIIDIYVEKWYDNNNDEVDIGRIQLWEIFGFKKEIDILPDVVEKHIYKKMMKILFSIITSPNQ